MNFMQFTLKMKRIWFNSIFVFSILFTSVRCRGVNGGMSCAVCTVLTGVIMQEAEIHEDDFVNATKRICLSLPTHIRSPCLSFVEKTGPYFSNLSEKFTPDLFCLVYGTCELDKNGNVCHLFSLPFQHNAMPQFLRNEELRRLDLPKIDFCELPYIREICKILNNSYTSLNPVEDFDGDGFSTMATGRGSDWRGKDCADNDPNTYPGRRPFNSDYFADSNCNGIWGTKNDTAWEEVLCKNSQPRGLIYIGDSIGAHFHMPEVWINSLIFSLPGLNASDVILDEIDWPQFGFATGFKNISNNILISGVTDSLYLRLRAWNRCNHRDYQNLSQNGASSYEGLNHVDSISRNQTRDKPAIVIYAMQGNDVCNNFNDTITHMTPPRVFKKNVLKALFLLDEKLPSGSHVILVELVQADFIYSAMAERVHPVGKYHGNVYYKNMYEWFNCLQIGPCTGWLNSNETLRNITSRKARKLSKLLRNIAKHQKFQHFDVHYIPNPITFMVNKKSVNVSELLEPVDSLHPNQKAQSIMTEVVWNFLKQLPGVLGPQNPHNQEIISIFGDQRGH